MVAERRAFEEVGTDRDWLLPTQRLVPRRQAKVWLIRAAPSPYRCPHTPRPAARVVLEQTLGTKPPVGAATCLRATCDGSIAVPLARSDGPAEDASRVAAGAPAILMRYVRGRGLASARPVATRPTVGRWIKSSRWCCVAPSPRAEPGLPHCGGRATAGSSAQPAARRECEAQLARQ